MDTTDKHDPPDRPDPTKLRPDHSHLLIRDALTPGTRSVDVLQFMNRVAGTVLQGNIDDISMTVRRK